MDIAAVHSECPGATDEAVTCVRVKRPNDPREEALLKGSRLWLAFVVAYHGERHVLTFLESGSLQLMEEDIVTIDPKEIRASDETVALLRVELLDRANEATAQTGWPLPLAANPLLPGIEGDPPHPWHLGGQLHELRLSAIGDEEEILVHLPIEESDLLVNTPGLRDALRCVLSCVLVQQLGNYKLFAIVDLRRHPLLLDGSLEIDAVRTLVEVEVMHALLHACAVGLLQVTEEHSSQQGVVASLMRQLLAVRAEHVTISLCSEPLQGEAEFAAKLAEVVLLGTLQKAVEPQRAKAKVVYGLMQESCVVNTTREALLYKRSQLLGVAGQYALLEASQQEEHIQKTVDDKRPSGVLEESPKPWKPNLPARHLHGLPGSAGLKAAAKPQHVCLAHLLPLSLHPRVEVQAALALQAQGGRLTQERRALRHAVKVSHRLQHILDAGF
mmetsp:Transcript_15744/g.36799  ORF Transcript_15744/g.36799 Transcript_15744/m.36799 type:complete len:443 (-) Transcript_15744:474-1802(-)